MLSQGLAPTESAEIRHVLRSRVPREHVFLLKCWSLAPLCST